MKMSGNKENFDPYKSSSFSGLSLWMCPKGFAEESFGEIIRESAKQFGTSDFIPHVTLLGALEGNHLLQKTRELGRRISPYELQVENVSEGNAYFQSIFMKMKTTPQVMQANAIARQIFGDRSSNTDYMPHLSLVYGDFETDEKKKMVEFIEQKMKKANAPTSFLVDSIQIWSTEGNVEDWHMVESVPLTGSCVSDSEEDSPIPFESLLSKSKSFFIPEDSVPGLLESPDVSPESTLTKDEADQLQASLMNTALLGRKLASAFYKTVEKSVSSPELFLEDSDFWNPR